MRTDISRDTFHPEKNYSSVRRQQGRVDLDADWNEQVDIQKHRNRILTVDSLGPVGAPANDAGFLIAPTGDTLDLTVSPGRFYVDGTLVHNENEFNISSQPDLPGVVLPATDGDYLAYLKVYERAITALEDPGIRETALGGPDTTTRMKVVRQIHLAPITAAGIDSRTIPPEWNTIVSRNAGRLSARTQADDAQSDPCSVGARGGYTGLDNLLYRVEIHGGGIAGSATYKWSRDNGALVTEWLEQDGDTLTLRSTGNDNVLNFAPGQWVELLDDGLELQGLPGTLAQILRVEGRRITINPDNIQHYPGSTGTLDITEFSRGVRKVRRWDMTGAVAPSSVPDGAAGETWVVLENGIEVKFDDLASGRDFRTGDYWMIPARADNNNIEWACDNNGNIEHPPHGVYFSYARLAFVNLTAGAWSTVADAREIFPGLTDEQLAYVGGDGQLSVPGVILDRPLEVRVTRGATPVPDAQVRFTVTSGTGTIEDAPGGTSGTTLDIKADADGIARVHWTLADAVAGQSVRAVLLDENDTETALYVVFGAGSGVASGIQYTPISTDSSVAGTTNVQEALDALADNKVNRSGDTMTGNLTVNADLEVTGNMTIRGDVIARDATQQAGDILLGDDDVDRVIIHGTVQSQHTSGALEIEAPVHTRTTDPTKSPLRVDGPSTGGSPRLYRLPLDVDHTNAGATTLNDYQLLLTVDTATPISAGRMKSDGGDILFENEDGSGLFYWVESGMNTATTRIWVRVPVITAAANRTIYMLYGNSNAVSQSSSANTFVREVSGVTRAYDLDEGNGTSTADATGNGNTGTLNGAVWAPGRFGQALSFDGVDDFVNADGTTLPLGNAPRTLAAWASPSTSAVDHDIAGYGPSVAGSTFYLNILLDHFRLVGHQDDLTDPGLLQLNAWSYVVATYDGTTARLYVNGAEVDAAAKSFNTLGSDFFLGRHSDASLSGTGIPYGGLIDQVRVYDRELASDEIADLYANPGHVSPATAGAELIRRFTAIEPVVTASAEEANPLSESPILFAQETSGNIGIGTDNPSEKLTVEGIIETKTGGIKFPDGTIQTTAGGPGGAGGDSLALGTIMAWHKDLAGTPPIPEGWVECNGQVLSDIDSPYDGLVIPNLNGARNPWNSKGSFLRGGTISGEFEDDTMQGHKHSHNGRVYSDDPSPALAHTNGSNWINNSFFSIGNPTDSGFGPPRIDTETRPVNMSVVWIMKIKKVDGQSGLWEVGNEGIRYDDGKVSVGTAVADEQLTVSGAISLEEKILEPDTTDDFGKLYVRENDLSHLSLNGTDQYVSMPALGDTAVGDFTIGLWIKLNRENPGPNNRTYVLDLRGDGFETIGLPSLIIDNGPDGKSLLRHRTGWPTGGSSEFQIDLGNIMGEWHHTALVREGSVLKAYFDGRLLSDAPTLFDPVKNDLQNWDQTWRVGTFSQNDPDDYWTNGDMDDLGLWTRALSDDEMATLHHGGRGSDVPTGFASSLLAFYPMSQSATPGQLDDVSGNNFHGTIQNGGAIIPERVGSLYFKDGFGNVTSLAGGGDSYRTGGSGNQVPLGTIMAWHKSFTNTPAIPDGWAECNGQTLDDPTSPYHGQVIPDLNNPKETWNSKGSFLRGDLTSGDFEDDVFQGHRHVHNAFTTTGGPAHAGLDANTVYGNTSTTFTNSIGDPLGDTTNGLPRTGPETNPLNMSVVWIMKIRETDRDRGLWREQGEDIYFDDGKVGVGTKTANAKLHVSAEDHFETPLRVDAQVTLQGIQGRLYRSGIRVDNTDTVDLIDHQVVVALDTAALVSQGKMRFDGADILFVDTNGTTILPHSIESGMNTPTTRIWVRVPAIAAEASRDIFIQYGKPDAVSLSSNAATFVRRIDDVAVAYDFEEGSGGTLNDISGNGINASGSGSWAAGYQGTAISLAGGTFMETGARNWGFSTTATVSAWIKTSQVAPGGNTSNIMSLKHGNVNNELEFAIQPGGDVALFNHNSVGVYKSRHGITNVLSGDWVHVVGVIDGGIADEQMRIYVNGVREDGALNTSGSPSPISDATPRTLRVGHRRDGVPEYFVGEIDMFRLYSRALSDLEIADLHASESVFLSGEPGTEYIRRLENIPPTVTFASEEPNPVSGSPVLFAQNLTGNIGVGTDEPEAKLHIAGQAGVDGIMFPDGTLQTTAGQGGGGGDSTPLGTIIAWHKSLSGTPAIPEGWVECNGQVLSDGDSPFDGQVIPNLNGDGRFLRGGGISGTLQEDAFQGHRHANAYGNHQDNTSAGGAALIDPPALGSGSGNVLDPITDQTNGTPRTADETRPVNMSVVWIMKVKQVGGQSGLWTPASEGIHYDEGKVSVGTKTADEQLTVSGAISLEEKILEPDTTDDFGKIYVRENDLSHMDLNGFDGYAAMPPLGKPAVGDFTIGLWFRLEQVLPLAIALGRQYIVDLQIGGGAISTCALYIDNTENGVSSLHHYCFWSSDGATMEFDIDVGNISGDWHHTALVREGSTIRVYLDGRLVGDHPQTGSPRSETIDFAHPWFLGAYFGQLSPSGAYRHKGAQDDLGIWERALSNDEMATLYNSGRGSDVPTAFASSLLAFYPMSQSATPGQLDDVSGNSFHGTLEGSANIIPEKTGSLYFKDGFGNVTALAGGGDSYRTGGSGNQVPVGTIMAWHKSLANTPAIPDGWVECNGQTLDDPASPYHGDIIPDLNNPKETWNMKGSFLRGDLTSGAFEDDAFQGHKHGYDVAGSGGGSGGDYLDNSGGPAVTNNNSIGSPVADGTNGGPRTGMETRPVNMSVVWIMKVRETDRDRGLWREQGEDIYFDDGKVGIGAKSANATLHISAEDHFDTPLRVDGQVTIQGVQGRLFRAPITLDNTDTVGLVDHQIALTIDTQTLVSAGKMRFDGGDVLFVDTDGKTILPHFIESGMNTATTAIWVRVPAIPAGESRGIFIQYGKADATTPGSTNETFVQDIDGVALAWDLEEGTGTTVADSSGNGNTANTSAAWVTGYRGTGLSFNGTPGLGMSTPRSWGFDAHTTISAWVKGTTGGSGLRTIAALASGPASNEFLMSVDATSGIVTVYNIDGASSASTRTSISSAMTGDWVHVVGVIDGGLTTSQIRVYVNGVREDGPGTSNASTPVSDATPRKFSVATRPSLFENFVGDIDQVRLYGRALSDQEVADMYANESLIAAEHPNREFIHKITPVAPTIVIAAEEPNPVSGSPILFAQNLTGNIGVGTDDPQGKLHIAGTAGVDGIVFPDGSTQYTATKSGGDSTPIGTIIAWHKSLGGTPAVPDGWVECNGQVLDDITSAYHGQVIPDLNNPKNAWNSKGSFLRGDTTSGNFEDDAFQGHHHTHSHGSHGGPHDNGFQAGSGKSVRTNVIPTVQDAIDDGTNGTPRVDSETRPVNMSVVWIMKIKQVGDLAWEPVPGGIAYAGGDVGIGTTAPNSKLTIDGALALSDSNPTPDETPGFGKLYARENSIRHLEFDGSADYVTMPSLTTTSVFHFSVSCWFKLNAHNPQGRSHLLDFRGDGAMAHGPALRFDDVGDGNAFLTHLINESSGDYQFQINVGDLTGEWHHTALVREGTLVRVYMDGVLVSENPALGANPGGSAIDFNHTWRMGTFAQQAPLDDQNNWFNGSLSQVAVWHRAVQPHEVAAIHAAGRETNLIANHAPSLFGYWPVDAMDGGTTLNDHTGNAHHGTIQANTSFASESSGSLFFKDGQGTTTPLAGTGFPLSVGSTGREVPLGTIMAWHKSLTGTPSMPPGWVECNGQVLSDGESPYDTQTMPNLNGDPAGADSPDVGDKKSMFLRGGLTSGTGQDDAFQGHFHNKNDQGLPEHKMFGSGGGTFGFQSATGHPVEILTTGQPVLDTVNGTPRTADETRPTNMSVVWIMKVKHVGNGAWEPTSSGLSFMGNRVGIGTLTPSFELDVNGTIQCVNLVETSDARRKKKVNTLGGALDLVDKLRGVRFEYDTDRAGPFAPPDGPQVGLIAQEVESVLPEVVTTDSNGYKAVQYGKLVAVLIEAIKELKHED